LRELLMNVDRDDRLDFVDLLYSASETPQNMEIKVSVGETARVLEAVVSRAGDFSQVLVTLQDITQRKIEERERSTMVERVSEAERLSALGTMAGGIAHEINTPVQYIGDNLRFIDDQVEGLLKIAERARRRGEINVNRDVDEVENFDLEFAHRETPTALKQALEGIDQIARIVQAVKEYSHPTNHKFAATDLNHAVETVVTITRNQWKYVTELQLDLDPLLPHISAVEGEINQVLVNLIVNASQAIAEKGESSLGHIWVSTRRIDNEVSITVGDDGPGIAAEHLKKIFDMFFTTKPPGKGTGQGLALVKSIVHRHGGMISVESELGKGASFVVRLPIEQITQTNSCLKYVGD
jgi:two-component system NtrC family sensor kinase